MDENGRVSSILERNSESKRIKIKPLSTDKNLSQLAQDIVDKCKYIHPSRVEEIEQLLIKLRKSQIDSDNSGRDGADNRQKSKNESKNDGQDDEYLSASMDYLDEYLDMLYQVSGRDSDDEGLKIQIKGTSMILSLCRNVMNLEQLIQNNTVMGALTRVLQEEYKKSVELTFNILRIFLAFSNFTEMHGLMANYRIGLLTMKVIEYEIKRVEHMEIENKERCRMNEADIVRAKENFEDVKSLLENIKKKEDKIEKKNKKLLLKQDKLLFVAFYILINLAEDITVEKKMLKKNLIDMLVSMLDRNYSELLILAINFNKKLSCLEENKEKFKSVDIINKLCKFLQCSSQPLVNIALRLLFNLSFDKFIREQMVKCGIVPKLISLLKTPSFRSRTLKLLYHLSADDTCKSMIAYTDAVPLLMGMVINFPQNNLAKELAALMINLSHNPRNVELIIANRGLNHLMDRLSETRDCSLLKIIRNITQWTFNQQQQLQGQSEAQYKWRGLWSPHLKIFLELSNDSENNDFLIELYGCLANFTANDLPVNSSWYKIVRDYNFLNQFSKMLVPGMVQNDVVLEIVMLLGCMAADPKVCELISTSNIITTLYQLWKEKGDDVEIKSQLIHTFYILFQCEVSRAEVMYSTRIVVEIIDCLNHKNAAIRNAADELTELVLEYDRLNNGDLGQLGKQIRKKRYEGFNMIWLKALDGLSNNYGGDNSDDYETGDRSTTYFTNDYDSDP